MKVKRPLFHTEHTLLKNILESDVIFKIIFYCINQEFVFNVLPIKFLIIGHAKPEVNLSKFLLLLFIRQ